MCIGIPMQVLSVREGFVLAQGRGEERELSSLLIGPAQPGDWVLAFLDSARELISPERAAEVQAVLDLLADALDGHIGNAPGFVLPSAQSASEVADLWGTPSDHQPLR
jgi:hydrogenase expression/formation protein HypC